MIHNSFAMIDTPLPSQANQETHEAQVISDHLPEGYSADFDGTTHAEPSSSTHPAPSGGDHAADDSAGDSDSNHNTSSLKLQGGDIHRGIFKTASRIKYHRRTATFHYPPSPSLRGEGIEGLTVNNQLAPGGFRRAFLLQKQQDKVWGSRTPITRNFIEFLDLYGSFAGEDLADSDEEAIDDEEEDERPPERRPLLPRRRSSHGARYATASTSKTFFTLLKAFIGTGIMFLPRAFRNGGILFSSMAMLSVSCITMLAFHLLLICKRKYGGGYGEIGQAIAGDRMRSLIMTSITLSQIGFVCAGIVFVAENLTSFLKAVFDGPSPLSTFTLVLLQVLVLIPLSFVRNIAKLGPTALVADVFILIGVGYIYWYDISYLVTEGLEPTVKLFNPDAYTLTVGSAIFTFEGIGLILPIESSMAKPERFEPLLGLVMFIITILFTSVGALCYATFGEHTSIEIINNYPQDSRFVNAVQFIYSLAVLVGNPVQLFPALRIMEGNLFGAHSGKRNVRTKWTKNVFRGLVVIMCGCISILGAGNLDRFVALIGSFACVPLVYIYPAYLHYRGVATSPIVKAADIAFMVLGLVGMVYTTVVTIVNSFL